MISCKCNILLKNILVGDIFYQKLQAQFICTAVSVSAGTNPNIIIGGCFMKKLALVLSLVLMLTFVGCSSKTTVKETDAFRFDSKTGYAYSTAPFGIDTTELESAIGSKLTMVSESPATAPFAYTNYSSEDIVQSADCSGKFDAQFDENGKLFSVTFHEQLARGTAEEHFEAASKRFTETFGAPAVQDDNGTGTQYLEWQDKSSGTALGLTYSDLGTTDPTLMISVFEKSRYVEAGTGDWK